MDISGHILCIDTLPRLLGGRGIRLVYGMSLSQANHMQSTSNQSNLVHQDSIQSSSIFQDNPVLGWGPAAGGEALRDSAVVLAGVRSHDPFGPLMGPNLSKSVYIDPNRTN